MEDLPRKLVLALVRDLIFASRIAAQGKSAGVAVKILRDPSQLSGEPAALLLVDLNQAGTIEAAAEWSRATGMKVVGFVSHVDVETINRARAAGIDQVMARSGLVEALPVLLAKVNADGPEPSGR